MTLLPKLYRLYKRKIKRLYHQIPILDIWKFIWRSLMRPDRPQLSSLTKNTVTVWLFLFLYMCFLFSRVIYIYLHNSWSQCCLVALKWLYILHYSVAYNFWSFVISKSIPGFLKNYFWRLMRLNCLKLACLPRTLHSNCFHSSVCVCLHSFPLEITDHTQLLRGPSKEIFYQQCLCCRKNIIKRFISTFMSILTLQFQQFAILLTDDLWTTVGCVWCTTTVD